jgi:hypothetical protein
VYTYEVYDLDDLLIYWEALRVSRHALREAYKEGLRGEDIIHAILNGQVVERYPERKRVLISGPVIRRDLPLHVVCDYADAYEIVAVTVYIPSRSRWAASAVRRRMRWLENKS